MSVRYPQQLLGLAFARDDDAHGLAGFAVHREMIRGRLVALAQRAYRGAWARLGAAACEASFARYLEASPPRSPLVREVVHGFAAFACADHLGEAAPYARCLLRFEAAKWAVADALAPPPLPHAELDFDGVPVLDPTLRVLALDWTVDDPAEAPARAAHALLVYRRGHDDEVRWYRAEPLFGALLARVAAEEQSLAAALPEVLASRGITPDAALLASLAGFLAVAVERGVVLGVRRSVS